MAAPKMLKDSVYSQRKQNLKLQRVNVEFIQLKKYFLVKNSIYIQNTGACAIKIKRKHYRELDWKAEKINVTIFYITPNIHILIRKKKKKIVSPRFQRYYPILDCACDVGSGDRVTANYARNRLLPKPGMKNSGRCVEFSRKTAEPIIFSCIELIIFLSTLYVRHLARKYL